MKGLEIIEYDKIYAKEIARMWRLSSKGWNGEWGDTTEEEILRANENTANINTYLAKEGEEILGYCSFKKYIYDENTLYVELLNVRFDKHGQGIGKALVKKTVERTMELEWPRLDLFTWPGNTKSIPLYKRCGFFLEDKNGQGHLMNFIPYAVNTEAVKEYFKTLDWYYDLKREINLEPEGRKDRNFEFYEYRWNNDDLELRMEFERRSRGLSLIETKDYLISLRAENQKLVFGETHKAVFQVVNKRGKDLSIEIQGINHKNIDFNMEHKTKVKEKEIIKGEFFINPLDFKTDDLKTHPSVKARVLINGKEAEFAIGIIPEPPVEIKFNRNNELVYCDQEDILNVDIENKFNEEVSLNFIIPKSEDVDIDRREFNLTLDKKERKTIKLPFILRKATFFNPDVASNIRVRDGREINFISKVALPIQSFSGGFGGEMEDRYRIANGKYSVDFYKGENSVFLRGEKNITLMTSAIFCPEIGMPYSEELTNATPLEVKSYEENNAMTLRCVYGLERFKDTYIHMIFSLKSNGIMESYFEVVNKGEDKTNEVFIKQPVIYRVNDGILPYDNGILKIRDIGTSFIEDFKEEKITENWIFGSTKDETRGLHWQKGLVPRIQDYLIYFQHEIGVINKGEIKRSKSIFMSLGTFRTFQELRNYAMGKVLRDYVEIKNDYDVKLNKGNPFIYDKLNLKISEYKNSSLEGKIRISSKNSIVDQCEVDLEGDSKEVYLDISGDINKDIVTIEREGRAFLIEDNKLMFRVFKGDVKREIYQGTGDTIYSLDNGIIKIKACKDFGPGIYSMNYKNVEFLETAFPTHSIKSWYNPWFGGIQSFVGLRNGCRYFLNEKIKMYFEDLVDNKGNKWSDLKISLNIKNFEELEGLTVNEHYLMLKGVPVLCSFMEIIGDNNKYISKVTNTTMFFNTHGDIKKCYAQVINSQGQKVKYKAGVEGINIVNKNTILFGHEDINEKLQVYGDFNNRRLMSDLNLEAMDMNYADFIGIAKGERIVSNPIFFIGTEEYIGEYLLKDFKNIRFF
ncbi:GNAT family N-acetyltransferase [Clostridium hydrogeniformans]|uniref:GNAT family N-acetyltransferase n=1 Tax=Clostridium hydrogeniformans TaxID=349933 RepID=UPI000489FCD5|nr:GNAT family N-acetyltransferase [Clostridium hydrogeniformans]